MSEVVEGEVQNPFYTLLENKGTSTYRVQTIQIIVICDAMDEKAINNEIIFNICLLENES